jgi:sugar phosphate isomerase/epimerase
MLRLGAITDEVSPNFERALDMICDWGVRDVEVHTVWSKNVESLTDSEVIRLWRMIEMRSLRVCCISSTVFLRCHLDDRDEPIVWRTRFRSIGGAYAIHLRALARSLEIAAMVGAPLVRVFGFWKDGPTTEDTYRRAAERLAQPIQMAQAAGVRLALENCPHTYFDWGERAAHLLDLIDSPWLGLLWDPCSSVRSGESDYLSGYGRFQTRVVHVHAKDIRVDPALKHGRAYLPIEQGNLDWHRIVACLARDSWEGVICLETHHLAADGTKETAATASFGGLSQIRREVAAMPEHQTGG